MLLLFKRKGLIMILGITPNFTSQTQSKNNNNVAFSARITEAQNSAVKLSEGVYRELAQQVKGICGKDLFEVGTRSLPDGGIVTTVKHIPAGDTAGLKEATHIVYSAQDPVKSITDWTDVRNNEWLKHQSVLTGLSGNCVTQLFADLNQTISVARRSGKPAEKVVAELSKKGVILKPDLTLDRLSNQHEISGGGPRFKRWLTRTPQPEPMALIPDEQGLERMWTGNNFTLTVGSGERPLTFKVTVPDGNGGIGHVKEVEGITTDAKTLNKAVQDITKSFLRLIGLTE